MKDSQPARFERIFLAGRRPFFWIAIVGFVIYFQVVFFGFHYFDDNAIILENFPFIKNLSNFFMPFFEKIPPAPGYYRPLYAASFIIDAQLGGTSPVVYHLTNVFWHVIASCLVFLVISKLNYPRILAFFSSLIFTVHPALSLAVGVIAGRNDLMVTVFILSSFLFFLSYLEDRKWKAYFLHILFFLLALFSKEIAIFLPLVCIVYLRLIAKKRFFLHEEKSLFVGWIVLLGIWFLLRQRVVSDSGAIQPAEAVGSLYLNLPALFLYLGKVFFPVDLKVFPTLENSTLFWGVGTIAVLVLLISVTKIKRVGYIIFGAVWFLAFLVPPLAFVNPKFTTSFGFMDHRIYLPFLGFIILMLETDITKKLDFSKRYSAISVFIILATLALITHKHTRIFKDAISFWKNAVEAMPYSTYTHRGLGVAYQVTGFTGEAIGEYNTTLKLNPNEPKVHNNLGTIYQTKGLLEMAESEYKKELEINPEFDATYFHLGSLYYQQKRFKEAEEMWIKAIEINPEYILAYRNLAVFYYEQKDYSNALRYYNEMQKRGVRDPKLLKSIESLK